MRRRGPDRRRDLGWFALWASASVHATLLALIVLGRPSRSPRVGFDGADAIDVSLSPPSHPVDDALEELRAPDSPEPAAPRPQRRRHRASVGETSEPLAPGAPEAPATESGGAADPTDGEVGATLMVQPAPVPEVRSGILRGVLELGVLGRGTPSGTGAGDGLGSGGGSGPDMPAPLPWAAPRCGDPMNGEWTALVYNAYYRRWMDFRLRIEREGDRLGGEILVHAWSGGRSDRMPPAACGPNISDYQVRMHAHGSVTGDRFDLDADSFEETVTCFLAGHRYCTDHFTGTVIESEENLYAVNNDGCRAINVHVRFHRTGCLAGQE
jgi:hypothetical protein